MSDTRRGYLHARSGSGDCPPFDELWACAAGTLSADRRASLNEHLGSCSWCAEKIARFNDPAAGASQADEPGEVLNRKVHRIWRPDPIGVIWRSSYLWMVLFLGAITASFYDPRHYKQFLVVALVCGIRWALSERAHRHSITVTRMHASGAVDRDPSRRVPSASQRNNSSL